jgi:uncharacterized protein
LKAPGWLLLALLLAPTVLYLWAFHVEPAWLVTRESELAIPAWPSACDGLRVVVLADLHVGSPGNGPDKLAGIVADVGDLHADLVLLAGDFVIQGVRGGRYVPPEDIAQILAKLARPPLGVFAVLGNHDAWLGADRVRAALEGAGIGVLEDAAVPLARGTCSFWLAGFGDYTETKHDVGAALAHATDARPVLAFTHNPDLFPDVPDRVSLTIAGHTHGGQVYVPFVGRPIVPSRYGERYAIGHVVENGRHLFVSPGIGTSLIGVRFLVPPEISVLVLRAEAGGP